jgi:uncharacterized protein
MIKITGNANTEQMVAIEKKLEILSRIMGKYVSDGVLITFSGGTDSAFLVWFARELLNKNKQGKVVALTTNSASMPEQDKQDAEELTRFLNIPHIWRESNEMENPAYLANDDQRCYHCKQELFTISKEEIHKLGLKWILYGYNASDRSDFRPGHRAAIENNVQYPLTEAGLTKDEIRAVLKEAGISVADKPASPCLSSRISHGIMVTSGKLADIAILEKIMREAGVKVCRARINNSGEDLFIRIEAAEEELGKILGVMDKLNSEGKKRGYKWVTLDLGGYRTGGGTE